MIPYLVLAALGQPAGLPHPPAVRGGRQAALDRLIEDCGRDAGCRGAFPDLRGDLAKVLARLDAGPIPVEVTNPGTGKIEATTLQRGTFEVLDTSCVEEIRRPDWILR